MEYKVLNCTVDKLEPVLNGMAKDNWILNHIFASGDDKIIVIMGTSTSSEENGLLSLTQQQSQLFKTMNTVIKSQQDTIESLIKNTR